MNCQGLVTLRGVGRELVGVARMRQGSHCLAAASLRSWDDPVRSLPLSAFHAGLPRHGTELAGRKHDVSYDTLPMLGYL
jgi:hypothetical protein